MSVTDQMVESATAYAEATPAAFHAGSPRPRRRVAVVACMDARLDLFRMLGLRIGDAHILRNAGGSVTDDTLRSLVISQRLLGARETVLVHHTDCGMTSFDDAQFRAKLAHETGSAPRWSMGTFRDPASDVRASLDVVRRCPWLVSHAARGFVYDVATRRLHEVDHRTADADHHRRRASHETAWSPPPAAAVHETPWLWTPSDDQPS